MLITKILHNIFTWVNMSQRVYYMTWTLILHIAKQLDNDNDQIIITALLGNIYGYFYFTQDNAPCRQFDWMWTYCFATLFSFYACLLIVNFSWDSNTYLIWNRFTEKPQVICSIRNNSSVHILYRKVNKRFYHLLLWKILIIQIKIACGTHNILYALIYL